MQADELDEAKQRLALIRSEQYPLGKELIAVVRSKTGDLVVDQAEPSDPFEVQPEKSKVDRILGQWITGEISNDGALNKLFPLAVHYRYGDIEERFHGRLSDKRRADFGFAEAVINAWYAVLSQVPDPMYEKYCRDFHGVATELDLGMTEEELYGIFQRRPPGKQGDGPGR